MLKFDKPSAEWAEFIFKNRNRDNNFTHDFDIVIGPIANDGVAYLLGRYEEGTLTIEELSDKLEYKKLNSQYFFGTDESLKYLKTPMTAQVQRDFLINHIVDRLTESLVLDNNMALTDALNIVYRSKVYQQLQD